MFVSYNKAVMTVAAAGALLTAPCAAIAQQAETATAPGSPASLAEFRALADAASARADIADILARGGGFSPALARADGKPAEALLSHEGKTASVWTGRKFLARGRMLDARSTDTRIVGAAAATPAGWRRDGEKLVHVESGLECPASFTLKDEERDRVLALAAVTAYDSRSLDVSCNYAIDGDAAVTVYASFYPDMSLEEHAAGAVAAIRQNFDIAGELPVAIIEIERKSDIAPTATLPTALSGGFDIGEINGVPYKTAIWLAKTHGWHVKARATYAQSDFTAEIAAAVLFGVNYLNIDMKNRSDPTSAGREV